MLLTANTACVPFNGCTIHRNLLMNIFLEIFLWNISVEYLITGKFLKNILEWSNRCKEKSPLQSHCPSTQFYLWMLML